MFSISPDSGQRNPQDHADRHYQKVGVTSPVPPILAHDAG